MGRVLPTVGSVLRLGARRGPYLEGDEWRYGKLDSKHAALPTEIRDVFLSSQVH